jgi:hypothetical protein
VPGRHNWLKRVAATLATRFLELAAPGMGCTYWLTHPGGGDPNATLGHAQAAAAHMTGDMTRVAVQQGMHCMADCPRCCSRRLDDRSFRLGRPICWWLWV